MQFDHPYQRICGVIIILAAVIVYDDSSLSTLHRLVLPLAMAAGALLLTRAATAVSFAVLVMSALSIRWPNGDWITAYAYPALALLSALALIILLGRSFRARIADTHEARWARRRSR